MHTGGENQIDQGFQHNKMVTKTRVFDRLDVCILIINGGMWLKPYENWKIFGVEMNEL